MNSYITSISSLFGWQGLSILPKDTVNYLTTVINQILTRRREHLERRNDFIQIMVDHEEEVKDEQERDKQDQHWGTLKKSKYNIM